MTTVRFADSQGARTTALAATLGALGGALLTRWWLLRDRARLPGVDSGEAHRDRKARREAASAGRAAVKEAATQKADSDKVGLGTPARASRPPQEEPEIRGPEKQRLKGSVVRAEAARETGMPREVVCADAMEWLARPGAIAPGSLVFTSLPDVVEVKEFAPSLQAWRRWFHDAVKAVLLALPRGAVAVFYQTDFRIPEVGQVSKAYLVLAAAAEVEGASLWWHKIVHFGNIDGPAFTPVQFTHLICIGKGSAPAVDAVIEAPAEDADEVPQRQEDDTPSGSGVDLGTAVPDVLARGPKPWGLRKCARCMGAHCVEVVLRWAQRRLPDVHTVVDPFCGAGTVLAIANVLRMSAVGVDLSPKRARQAAKLDGEALLRASREELAETALAQKPPAAGRGTAASGKRARGRGRGGQ